MAPMGPFCKPRVFTRGYDFVQKIYEVKELESQILAMRAEGKTRKEIAESLGLKKRKSKIGSADTTETKLAKKQESFQKRKDNPEKMQSQHARRKSLGEQAYEINRLKMENEQLRDFFAIRRKEVKPSFKYVVIHRHCERYSVKEICCFFEVSRSGYYKYLKQLKCPAKDFELAETC